MVQERVAPDRIGAAVPDVCDRGLYVSAFFVERLRIAAMAIGATDLYSVLGVHVANIRVALDAALAFGKGVCGGLASEVIVPHQFRDWIRRVVGNPESSCKIPGVRSLWPDVGLFGTVGAFGFIAL